MILCITIFVSLYLLNFLLDLWLDHLNIKNIGKYEKVPPAPFQDHVPLDRYQKSIAYTKRYSRFSNIVTTINSIIFLAFVYSGGLNALDAYLAPLITSEIWRGLAFFAILMLASSLLGIPASLYQTFVIEEEFGFNRQTKALWIKDRIKSLLLSLVMLLPLGYGILYFMQAAGAWWWLYTWIVVFLFGFTLSKLYPVVIAPLFNKFTPLEAGSLREMIEQLATAEKFPIENVYVMDASQRSTHSNAYFAGFGKTKRLVLFDSLIENFSEEEIIAVVAHEIGHYKKKHLLQHMIFSQTTSLLFFFLLSIAKDHPLLYQTFLVENSSSYMGLFLLSCVCSVAFSIFAPLSNWLSWRFEYEADRYAYKIVEAKQAIKTLLIKLAEKNLSNLTPHPWYARFHYSHPPILSRLSALGLDKE